MNTKRILLTLIFVMSMAWTYGQREMLMVRITGTDDVTTTVKNITTSSSSSCMTSDFPVYQGETRSDVNFRDLKKIVFRRDKPASNPVDYLTIELVKKDGTSGLYEIIRYIRFMGKTNTGDFTIKVDDIKSVEILD